MKKRNFLKFGIFLVTASLISSPDVFAANEITEEFNKTLPIDPSGEFLLENVNGKIDIVGWDKNEVQIAAVKRAKTQEQLDELKIEIEADSDRVRIRTKYPDKKWGISKNNGNSGSVDYQVKVPRTVELEKIASVNGRVAVDNMAGRIKVDCVNGQVSVTGASNAIDLSTVNGQVQADVSQFNEKGSIRLNSVNGSLTLALPSNVDANVSVNSLNGSIKTDLPLTVKKHFPIGRDMNGTLGKGGPSVKISTVNGGITIKQKQQTASAK